MQAWIEIERADEREELEPFAGSGRRRLARAANRQPKAEQHDRNERGDRGIHATRGVQRDEHRVAGDGAEHGHHVEPRARAVSFLFRHDIGHQPGVRTRRPVPPELEMQERERVQPYAPRAVERCKPYQCDRGAEHASDEKRSPTPMFCRAAI